MLCCAQSGVTAPLGALPDEQNPEFPSQKIDTSGGRRYHTSSGHRAFLAGWPYQMAIYRP